MLKSKLVMLLIFAISLLCVPFVSSAQFIGSATIHAPAVIVENNTGSLTTFNLNVTSGNGHVSVFGPQTVANSTLQSALTAAQYASKYLNLNFSTYNFSYQIIGGGDNVSGPSAGAAMTLLAISAISGKRLNNNFSITGTISGNGTIGPIGGVYDKASAVKQGGLSYLLVPAVQNTSLDDELYLLVQDTFNIPVVQVANVTQALGFSFGRVNAKANETNFTFNDNLSVSKLRSAPLACINSCDLAPFYRLTNFTFSFTNSSISALSLNPSFSNVQYQMRQALAQYRQISAKGYLYGGANLAFLSYLDSFFFNSYLSTTDFGLKTLQSIQNSCDSLTTTQLTSTNYEYVIAGELRQAWGEYTANATISGYNLTVETTDDVLFAMHDAASANAWCSAANKMYGISGTIGGVNVVPSSALGDIAYGRISRASAYGQGMYLSTAEDAYAVNNYPLAIIDADYAYAIANATTQTSLFSTAQLLNISNSMALRSTYGVWATQFANEAEFYIQESRLQANQTQANSYAREAYSSALLASQISNDTKVINDNLIAGNGTQRINSIEANQSSTAGAQNGSIQSILQTTYYIYVIAVVMLVINIVLFLLIVYLLLPAHKASKKQLNTSRKK